MVLSLVAASAISWVDPTELHFQYADANKLTWTGQSWCNLPPPELRKCLKAGGCCQPSTKHWDSDSCQLFGVCSPPPWCALNITDYTICVGKGGCCQPTQDDGAYCRLFGECGKITPAPTVAPTQSPTASPTPCPTLEPTPPPQQHWCMLSEHEYALCMDGGGCCEAGNGQGKSSCRLFGACTVVTRAPVPAPTQIPTPEPSPSPTAAPTPTPTSTPTPYFDRACHSGTLSVTETAASALVRWATDTGNVSLVTLLDRTFSLAGPRHKRPVYRSALNESADIYIAYLPSIDRVGTSGEFNTIQPSIWTIGTSATKPPYMLSTHSEAKEPIDIVGKWKVHSEFAQALCHGSACPDTLTLEFKCMAPTPAPTSFPSPAPTNCPTRRPTPQSYDSRQAEMMYRDFYQKHIPLSKLLGHLQRNELGAPSKKEFDAWVEGEGLHLAAKFGTHSKFGCQVVTVYKDDLVDSKSSVPELYMRVYNQSLNGKPVFQNGAFNEYMYYLPGQWVTGPTVGSERIRLSALSSAGEPGKVRSRWERKKWVMYPLIASTTKTHVRVKCGTRLGTPTPVPTPAPTVSHAPTPLPTEAPTPFPTPMATFAAHPERLASDGLPFDLTKTPQYKVYERGLPTPDPTQTPTRVPTTPSPTPPTPRPTGHPSPAPTPVPTPIGTMMPFMQHVVAGLPQPVAPTPSPTTGPIGPPTYTPTKAPTELRVSNMEKVALTEIYNEGKVYNRGAWVDQLRIMTNAGIPYDIDPDVVTTWLRHVVPTPIPAVTAPPTLCPTRAPTKYEDRMVKRYKMPTPMGTILRIPTPMTLMPTPWPTATPTMEPTFSQGQCWLNGPMKTKCLEQGGCCLHHKCDVLYGCVVPTPAPVPVPEWVQYAQAERQTSNASGILDDASESTLERVDALERANAMSLDNTNATAGLSAAEKHLATVKIFGIHIHHHSKCCECWPCAV
jgi:hypothetical protein